MIDHILWWAEPEKNALWYRHVGCDDPPARWLVPLDDVVLPDERKETEAECAFCCYVRPLKARDAR